MSIEKNIIDTNTCIINQDPELSTEHNFNFIYRKNNKVLITHSAIYFFP